MRYVRCKLPKQLDIRRCAPIVSHRATAWAVTRDEAVLCEGLVLVFPILLLGFCKLLDVTMVERAGLR